NPVVQGSSKGEYAVTLFRENTLRLLLEEFPVVLDHKILWRVGADRVPVQLFRPLTRVSFLLTALQGAGAEPLLKPRQPASQPQTLRVDPDLTAGNVQGLEVAFHALRC